MSASRSPERVYTSRGLPTYVVLDVSGSMLPYEELLNDTLMHIFDTIDRHPQISEFIHLSIITFNTEAFLVTSMTDFKDVQELPRVECRGMTNFGLAFDLLRRRIETDIPLLVDAGVAVVRPVVFLLTDGDPSDPDRWKGPLNELKDRSWKPHPNIITYGFGSASERILAEIATAAAYKAERGDTGEALTAALTSLLNSMVASAKNQELRIPESVRGYRSIPLDPLDFVD
ncbi:vWA domain-containing protein [Rhizohabitans arisaemae]|uniref:vWA domain-containing protein n=1 Tax=Rhizohabitans arisaemae TaxID=2720610 RepID=UPI0024B09C8D|nr:VWA domain-containing protein [Rhizohabitans arisaemae]